MLCNWIVSCCRKHFNWLSYVSAGIEFFVAAIVSLLLFDPVGKVCLYTIPVVYCVVALALLCSFI